MERHPRFSKRTIEFIQKASRQKRPDWLDRHREEFEEVVRGPLTHLAGSLAKSLRALAPGYHFPLRGLGRLKRSADRAAEYGSFFRSYVTFTITRPSKSRFDHNPSLFFMINADDDEGDEVLLAGGLYMPSSRQLRSIRERISENPTPFEALFKSPAFAASFPEGFSDERTATRPPRGFDRDHSHIHWLKLQGFFVWRSYKKREYASAEFPELVARDGKQILRLNELLHRALANDWPEKRAAKQPGLRVALDAFSDATDEGAIVLHKHDF